MVPMRNLSGQVTHFISQCTFRKQWKANLQFLSLLSPFINDYKRFLPQLLCPNLCISFLRSLKLTATPINLFT